MKGNNKNIVWIDIETTGICPETDRIIKLDMVKVEKATETVLSHFTTMFNPEGVKSSPEAFEKHHIEDDMLESQPLFKDMAEKVMTYLNNSDLGCHNLRFDLNFLMAEFNRCGINFTLEKRRVVETTSIYREYHTKGLVDMYTEYCGGRKPRKSMSEVDVIMRLYSKMVAKHNLSEDDIDRVCGNNTRIDLDGMFVRSGKSIVLGRGKHKGEAIESVQPDYFAWMYAKSKHLNMETKGLARRVYNYLKKLGK